jgi:hypothetical protein
LPTRWQAANITDAVRSFAGNLMEHLQDIAPIYCISCSHIASSQKVAMPNLGWQNLATSIAKVSKETYDRRGLFFSE